MSSYSAQTPSRSSFPIILAILGVFAVFFVLLLGLYLGRDVTDTAPEATERPSLTEHRAGETAVLANYEVLDKETGKVRLPIERAMELVVAEALK